MNTEDKMKIISAVELASVSNVSNLTNDRIEALAGGHGMLNMAIHTVANVITEELLKGNTLSIEFADVRRLPVADIMEKAIKVAKKSGADGANAALITASIMYLAGSAAQVGIPAGNRKLGATARMLAGVDRSGVAAIPTAKMNNKISAFPAVLAVNQALLDGTLTSVNGNNVPDFVGDSPLYGHSALGEDTVWPEMAVNGARIGTEAMMQAMAGAGMIPHPFTCAVLGSAAILEIIHPDAEVPEGEGTYGRTTSVYLVGKSAVKTAGLPEKVHLKVLGTEFDTAKLIGDIGLILKDIGAPSVIGMMAFDEIFSIFEERIVGSSGGYGNSPMGHVGAYAIIGMKALVENKGDVEKTAKQIIEEKKLHSFNPEVAFCSINTVCRKANELHSGPITKMLIDATEPARAHAIHWRALYTLEELEKGTSLEDIVRALDDKKVETTEKYASAIFTKDYGQPIEIKVRKIAAAARRTSKLAKKYWSFDPLVDITVKRGNETVELNGLSHDIIPKVVKGNSEYEDVRWAISFASAVANELSLNGCNTLNVIVPAAVASAMKLYEPKEAASIVEEAGYISRAIPGGKMAATKVAKLALDIVNYNA
ncbi:hypothetical protein [Intestinibacter sp.]|uniref:hypothetical protein n=1 Tax=Intestinibacter sp. TaxID=1965304 RepID=UPI003F16E96E